MKMLKRKLLVVVMGWLIGWMLMPSAANACWIVIHWGCGDICLSGQPSGYADSFEWMQSPGCWTCMAYGNCGSPAS